MRRGEITPGRSRPNGVRRLSKAARKLIGPELTRGDDNKLNGQATRHKAIEKEYADESLEEPSRLSRSRARAVVTPPRRGRGKIISSAGKRWGWSYNN